MIYYKKFSEGREPDQTSIGNNIKAQGMRDRINAVMITDQDVVDKRWAECEKCDHLTTNEKLGKTYNKCDVCKCFMKVGDMFVKTRVATAACPIGKWDKEYE